MALDKIIVLDDELIIRRTLEAQLRKRKYSVATASTLEEAENLLIKDRFDLMFVDVQLPDGDGTNLLERLANNPDSPMVVIMTGNGTVESAVNCMRMGAFDYIIKPFSIDQIDVLVKKAESFRQLVRVNQYYSTELRTQSEIVGKSPGVMYLKKLIKKVAATEATVLITGENGTGKELVAHELYKMSPRSNRPYIRVNCAAISESLIESEFFGHEKGAFTGATQRREGRFELANDGTILLDEIGEISPQIQAKLLRVLQEREFERVGGNRTIKVNVRVLATTNRDLKKEVEEGNFREDLYYRLNVFPIQVQALRERGEDILLLAEQFLARFAKKHGVKLLGFDDDAKQQLMGHSWPGNVRELQNTIERAVILSDNGTWINGQAFGFFPMPSKSVVAAPAQPAVEPVEETPAVEFPAESVGAEPETSGPLQSLEEMERYHILRALKATHGKRKEAAELLDISTRTLRNKINQYRSDGVEIPGDE